MFNLGKTILTKASGEEKVIEGKLLSLMTAHPVICTASGLIIGFVLGHVVR